MNMSEGQIERKNSSFITSKTEKTIDANNEKLPNFVGNSECHAME